MRGNAIHLGQLSKGKAEVFNRLFEGFPIRMLSVIHIAQPAIKLGLSDEVAALVNALDGRGRLM